MSDNRIFSEDELVNILAQAEALQKLEETRNYQGLLESAKESLSLESLDKGITLEIVYGVAQELGVPQKYVQKALELQYIPPEKQIEDIRNHKSIVTPKLVARVYKRELLRSLREFSPLERFDVEVEPYADTSHFFSPWNNFLKIKENPKKGLIGRILKNRVQHLLARVRFNENSGWFKDELGRHLEFEFTLEDPLFLRACGNTLNELKDKRFSGQVRYRITHTYET